MSGKITMFAEMFVPFKLLVKVADVWLVTTDVKIEKLAVEAPAAMVTVAGNITDEELEVTVTVNPPAGARPLRVILPVAVNPPMTEAGAMLNPVKLAGVMVNVADFVTELPVALIDTLVNDETASVLIVKLTLFAPAGTVTVAGDTAAEELEPRLMTTPPLGALAVSVNVPVTLVPPCTVLGDKERLIGAGGFTMS